SGRNSQAWLPPSAGCGCLPPILARRYTEIVGIISAGGPDVKPGKFCGECGFEVEADAVQCDHCRSLLYGDRLQPLVQAATELGAAGRLAEAKAAWTEALRYLPRGSQPYKQVEQAIGALDRQMDPTGAQRAKPATSSNDRPSWAKKLG